MRVPALSAGFAAAAFAFVSLTATSSAITIVSTLTSTTTFQVSGNVTATVWQAQEFITDGTPYNLDSVTVELQNTGNYNDTSPIAVHLFSDNAGEPDSLLYTLSGDPTPSTPLNTRTPFVYTPTGPATLDANTTYHVLLHSSGDGFYNWALPFLGTVNTTGPGTVSASRETSSDSGGTWFETSTPFYFAVEGTPIPEPGAGILLALAALCGASTRRR